MVVLLVAIFVLAAIDLGGEGEREAERSPERISQVKIIENIPLPDPHSRDLFVVEYDGHRFLVVTGDNEGTAIVEILDRQ